MFVELNSLHLVLIMTSQAQIKLWQVPTSTLAEQEQLQPKIKHLHHQLSQILERFARVTLAHSLAVEDMVLTDVIAKLGLAIDVFVLNTGKLHAETAEYLSTVKAQYPNISISVFNPQDAALSSFAQDYEFVDIYQSLAARKACCHARKTEPLQRALQHYQAWLTGQRREQSVTRSQLAEEEFDSAHQIYKFNPLAQWSQQEVWAYIQQQQIPINPLYERGMPSIGCEPCTKAIRQDEELRAGRWWWENQDSKECGLHAR